MSVAEDATEPADDQEEPAVPHWYRLVRGGDALVDRGVPRSISAGTAAVHVVEHVEERLNAPRAPGFEGRFAGRELRGAARARWRAVPPTVCSPGRR